MIKDFLRFFARFLVPSFTLGFLLLGQLFPITAWSSGTIATPSCEVAVVYDNGQIEKVFCPQGVTSNELMSALASKPGVQSVSPVHYYKASLEPNDPDFKLQKNYLDRIKVPEAWDKPVRGTLRPVIAVLDSGVDINNPDLKNNIWFNAWEVPGDGLDNDGNGFIDDQYGWDFVANNSDPLPKFDSGWTEVAMNHGTIVAGVAAAAGNNSTGVAGVAWQARLMPIRVLNGKGVGDTVTVAKGINYAITNHADIINLSFVGSESDPALEGAITRAYQAGILVVAAAGNEQQAGVDMDKQPQYPVCNDGLNGENQVIGVAAVDDIDKRAEFSNYGSRCIDLAAPGVKIYSTEFVSKDNKKFQEYYGGFWSGTSVAAPLVSGSLALLKAAYPRLSPSQLRDVLIASADEINIVNSAVSGKIGRRLNLKAALDLAGSAKFPYKSPIVVASATKDSQVASFDISGEALQGFPAYDAKVNVGVNIAAGDINGDGQTDIITAPRAGFSPLIRIFNQKGALEFEFYAFPEVVKGGVSLAVADLTGDGKDDIVVGTGKRGANLVRVFDGEGSLQYQFVPYDLNYSGGINLAVGDVDGDSQPEIIVAPQTGYRLPVRVFSKYGFKKSEFYPYGSFAGGINLAVGDLDGDNKFDIITAPALGSSHIRLLNYRGKVLRQFFAYDKRFSGGVNIAVGDVNGDGQSELVTVPASRGGPHVKIWNSKAEMKAQFFAGPAGYNLGLTVAIFR